jgi:hypothetical protein
MESETPARRCPLAGRNVIDAVNVESSAFMRGHQINRRRPKHKAIVLEVIASPDVRVVRVSHGEASVKSDLGLMVLD